jgi:hypothetical protein
MELELGSEIFIHVNCSPNLCVSLMCISVFNNNLGVLEPCVSFGFKVSHLFIFG